jgi:Mechanosensitive ion channel, conserved TM helix
MSHAVTDALRSVLLFLPKALGFVAILVVGWIVARVFRSVVDKVLARVGFDRAVERGGIRAALARSRYDASDLVARLVYYAVLLFTLQLAFGIWGPNPVSDLLKGVVAWLPKAFVAIVIVVVAAAVASAVRDIVRNALGGLSYGRLLAAVAAWFIVGLGIIAALNQIGVATTVTMPVLIAVLATIAGILVVGVGGGLVRPMQARWDRWLDRASDESHAIVEHARAYQAGQADARRALRPEPVEPVPAAPAPPASNPAASGPATANPVPAGATATGPAVPQGSDLSSSEATQVFAAPPVGYGSPSEPTQVLPTTRQQPPSPGR